MGTSTTWRRSGRLKSPLWRVPQPETMATPDSKSWPCSGRATALTSLEKEKKRHSGFLTRVSDAINYIYGRPLMTFHHPYYCWDILNPSEIKCMTQGTGRGSSIINYLSWNDHFRQVIDRSLNLLVELEWLGQSEQADVVGDGGVIKVFVGNDLGNLSTLKMWAFHKYRLQYSTFKTV